MKAASGLERIMCRVLIKEPQESMDRGTGRHDVTEILLKMAFNTTQSINQYMKKNALSGRMLQFLIGF